MRRIMQKRDQKLNRLFCMEKNSHQSINLSEKKSNKFVITVLTCNRLEVHEDRLTEIQG